MSKNRLLLVDGNSIAFRAFFALHNSLEKFRNQNGLHTNAIYAFNTMLENVIAKEKPTHILVAFDAGKTTFRHEFYDEYKAGRSKTPSEFKEQLPYIRELLNGLGIRYYELDQYEADDIIGTMAEKVDTKEFDVVIVTGDRDLTQLATDTITVDVTVKGVSDVEPYTPETIEEKYGLKPKQIIDMKGLVGDASDNIPGVTKIGEKTAIKLLKEYGSIENLYEHIDELKASKMKENLIADKEQAFLSKRLATIDTNAPIQVKINELKYDGADLEKLVPFYKEMNFQSFLKKLNIVEESEPKEEVHFELVQKVDETMFGDQMSLYVEMLDDNYHTADIVGVAWGTQDKIYVYDGDQILFDPLFKEWASDKNKCKSVFDAKRTYVALQRFDVHLEKDDFDLLLAAYLLDTNDNSQDVASVANHYGYTEIDADEVVYGKGVKKGLPEDPMIFHEHLARKIKAIHTLQPTLTKDLQQKNQYDLFAEMELPLTKILAQMEITGITVNASRLQEMKQEFAVHLQQIEESIYAQAGEKFNLNSPKQLGVILFEKMGLPVIKKTKTGYSTAVDVLEQLRAQAPIVDDILRYRQIMKIQSTYVEGLLKVIQPDGKIHTRYVQTLTQTGRLSSVDPNLQNIPIRLEEGRKIRQAFIPREKGWKIFSADYSQIELRVLAAISQDPHMMEAFEEGQDIHASTARRVFGIDKNAVVDGNMRRQAKAVNFGIVYGISDYGLSQNLGITRKQAQTFIDTYFEKYPGVKAYMENIVHKAKQDGFVETLYHRRRYLPDIYSKNYNIRSFAERTAINTPIQGSAADILKIAMIKIADELTHRKMQATLLLQVHDELVFEVPEEELDELQKLVTETMEHAVELSVPLKVDCSSGDTWYDAK